MLRRNGSGKETVSKGCTTDTRWAGIRWSVVFVGWMDSLKVYVTKGTLVPKINYE